MNVVRALTTAFLAYDRINEIRRTAGLRDFISLEMGPQTPLPSGKDESVHRRCSCGTRSEHDGSGILSGDQQCDQTHIPPCGLFHSPLSTCSDTLYVHRDVHG